MWQSHYRCLLSSRLTFIVALSWPRPFSVVFYPNDYSYLESYSEDTTFVVSRRSMTTAVSQITLVYRFDTTTSNSMQCMIVHRQ